MLSQDLEREREAAGGDWAGDTLTVSREVRGVTVQLKREEHRRGVALAHGSLQLVQRSARVRVAIHAAAGRGVGELARAAVLRGDEARHEGRHLVELAVVQLH